MLSYLLLFFALDVVIVFVVCVVIVVVIVWVNDRNLEVKLVVAVINQSCR